MSFERVRAERDERGRRRLVPTGEPDEVHGVCDEVLVARFGRGKNAFPWIERNVGIEFDQHGRPVLDAVTLQVSLPQVFFRRPWCAGPKLTIIWRWRRATPPRSRFDKFLHWGEDGATAPRARHHAGVAEDGHLKLEKRQPGSRRAAPQGAVEPSRTSRCATSRSRSSSASMPQTARKEAQRCLQLRRADGVRGGLCIECDACVDICPPDSTTFTDNGRTRLGLRQWCARRRGMRSRRSTSRVCGAWVSRTRTFLFALPAARERCPTGCYMQKFLLSAGAGGPPAASAPPRWREDERSGQLPQAVNDFVVKFANVNGSGSASANALFARPAAHGRAGQPAEHLPVELPGPADVVRGARQRAGWLGRRGGVDLMVAMNPQTLKDHAPEVEPGGWRSAATAASRCRARAFAATSRDRHAADRSVHAALHRPAPAPASEEHRLRRRAGRPPRHRPGGDRYLLGEQYKGKAKLIQPSLGCFHHAPPRPRISRHDAPGLRIERRDAVGRASLHQAAPPPALGCVYGGATVCALDPITPSSRSPRCSRSTAASCASTRGERRQTKTRLWCRIASIWASSSSARAGTRRVPSTATGRVAGHRIIGLAYFADSSGDDHRRASTACRRPACRSTGRRAARR